MVSLLSADDKTPLSPGLDIHRQLSVFIDNDFRPDNGYNISYTPPRHHHYHASTGHLIQYQGFRVSGFRFYVHRCPYDEIMEKNEGKRRVHGVLWLWITCHTLGCTLCCTPSVNAALVWVFFPVPTVSPRIALCLRKCNLAKEKKHSKLSYLQRKMSVHS